MQPKDPGQHVTITITNNGRMFEVLSNAKLTLINITIKNGNTGNDGAVIDNGHGGTLVITNCNFINNTARNGGAIYNGHGALNNIINCSFINNTASNGGAISNGGLNVINCSFINNTAHNGGAIYIAVNDILNAVNSTFKYNSASGLGSVIYNPTTGSISVDSSVFYKNTGSNVIYSNNVNVDLNDNFYFWVLDSNNPDDKLLSDLISETINDIIVDIGSYYYIDLSYPLSDGSGNLVLNYAMKNQGSPTANGLTVTDISLKNNNIDVAGFDFTSISQSIPLTVDGNLVGLYYNDELFHKIHYLIATDLVLDSDVSGYVGDMVELIATLTNNSDDGIEGAIIYFYLSDGTLLGYNVTDGSGIAIFRYFADILLDTQFYANYTGNNTYELAQSVSKNIKIEKKDTALTLNTGDVSGYVGDMVELIATLTNNSNSIVGAIIKFYLANGSYIGENKTDVNGIARFYYLLPTELDTTYYAKYDGNNTYNPSTSSSAKIASIAIIPISDSQINLYKNTDIYYVGDYITLTWSTTNITNPNTIGTIYFYEDGKLQHSIQARLSDGVLVYQFKKSHKSLNINLRFIGDNVTRSSQSTVSTIVYDKFIVNIIPGVLTVAKRGYINITVNDLDDKPVDGGFITLQFDNYDIFKIPVVNGVAQFSKVLMQAGNNRLLRVSYVDSSNLTRLSTKNRVRVNKGTPIMTLSLNPNNRAISNRVAITATVSSGVVKQKYVNIPYTVRFYSSGKLAHTINKKFSASSNSFVYNFKRTHSNLIITATLGTTANYNSVTKKSSNLIVA